MTEQLETIARNFFTTMWIEFSELHIKEENKWIFFLKILSSDSGIMIGQHGKTLADVKMILKLLFSKHLQESIILHLEVNDYLESKDKKLLEMVQAKVDYIKKVGWEVKLPELSSYERKKVHSYVSDLWDEKIYTRSEWEGKDRRMFIWKKQEKISIDIDATDI
jgi:spoIIIJ-associated protein